MILVAFRKEEVGTYTKKTVVESTHY